jgi:hypothetical protein
MIDLLEHAIVLSVRVPTATLSRCYRCLPQPWTLEPSTLQRCNPKPHLLHRAQNPVEIWRLRHRQLLLWLALVPRPVLGDSRWRVCLAHTAGIQVLRHLQGVIKRRQGVCCMLSFPTACNPTNSRMWTHKVHAEGVPATWHLDSSVCQVVPTQDHPSEHIGAAPPGFAPAAQGFSSIAHSQQDSRARRTDREIPRWPTHTLHKARADAAQLSKANAVQ